jgi:hypothetical protein
MSPLTNLVFQVRKRHVGVAGFRPGSSAQSRVSRDTDGDFFGEHCVLPKTSPFSCRNVFSLAHPNLAIARLNVIFVPSSFDANVDGKT